MDLPKLPIVEGVVAFLIGAIAITFAGAFAATDENIEGSVVEPTAQPTAADGPDGSPPPSPDGAIGVVMGDNSFDPEDITVQGGSPVTFEITNDGRAIHNLHIAGPDGEYSEDFCDGATDPCSDPNRVPGGQTATLTWDVPPAPGEVDFRCDFHPQEMTGTITIE